MMERRRRTWSIHELDPYLADWVLIYTSDASPALSMDENESGPTIDQVCSSLTSSVGCLGSWRKNLDCTDGDAFRVILLAKGSDVCLRSQSTTPGNPIIDRSRATMSAWPSPRVDRLGTPKAPAIRFLPVSRRFANVLRYSPKATGQLASRDRSSGPTPEFRE